MYKIKLKKLKVSILIIRSPFLSLEDSRDDDRVMRRRSVATVPLSLESRRRASIPFLPRPPSPLLVSFINFRSSKRHVGIILIHIYPLI